MHLGFAPSSMVCDKDWPEINAIQLVWQIAKVQLGFWHIKCVIRVKLKESNGTITLKNYLSEQAKALVPCLEIFWGPLL